MSFGKGKGTITVYQAGGVDLLRLGPIENYFRVPTDVDLLMGNPPASIHRWRAAGLDCLERHVLGVRSARIAAGEIEVLVTAHLCAPGSPHGIDSELRYRIYGNGSIRCETPCRSLPICRTCRG